MKQTWLFCRIDPERGCIRFERFVEAGLEEWGFAF
jgi:hypothetical protein